MSRHIVLACIMAVPLVTGAFAQVADRPDLAEADLDRLQGSWVRLYGLLDGTERPLSAGKVILSFSGNKFVIKAGDELLEEGTIDLFAPDKSPKEFEHTVTKGGPYVQLGKKYPGIYLLLDDLYIACTGVTFKFPSKFEAEAGSNNLLVIYKRLKK